MNKLTTRSFTMIEMMVALSVLAIIIFLSGNFVIKCQKLWQTHRINSTVHQNGKLLLDVITRDIRAMVTSDNPNATIAYANDSIGDHDLVFVSSSGLGVRPTDFSTLTEIGYEVTTDSELIRYMTTSDTPSTSPSSDWDFYSAAPSSYDNTWRDSTILAPGVRSFNIRLYNSPLTLVTTDSSTVKPDYAVVDVTLYDPVTGALSDSDLERSARSFSKIIYLPQ